VSHPRSHLHPLGLHSSEAHAAHRQAAWVRLEVHAGDEAQPEVHSGAA
jgi:hypothetical protein